MSNQELKTLKNFKISNEFGEIKFIPPQDGIDLTEVDLFNDVEII
jgi:hypothetical protein